MQQSFVFLQINILPQKFFFLSGPSTLVIRLSERLASRFKHLKAACGEKRVKKVELNKNGSLNLLRAINFWSPHLRTRKQPGTVRGQSTKYRLVDRTPRRQATNHANEFLRAALRLKATLAIAPSRFEGRGELLSRSNTQFYK